MGFCNPRSSLGGMPPLRSVFLPPVLMYPLYLPPLSTYFWSWHSFFRDLLRSYGIKTHHLNPNWILHISTLVNLCECYWSTCECYLGSEPHFAIWLKLLTTRILPDEVNPTMVGGANIQLRLTREYFYIPFISSNGGCH